MSRHAVQDCSHGVFADAKMEVVARISPAATDRTLGILHRFVGAFKVAFPGQSGVCGWIQVRRTADESGQFGCECIHHFPRSHACGHAFCIREKPWNVHIPTIW